jgi:molecular chaperone DnaK (HSP70)
MTRTQAVRELVEEVFQRLPDTSQNPMEAVAR